jgi:HTH-type transcriptional regulator/antitoxin HigA
MVFQPDWVSAPGETIADIMEERRISAAELARRLGCSGWELERLISGDFPISAKLAGKLAQCLGGSRRFWRNRERHFREFLAGRPPAL